MTLAEHFGSLHTPALQYPLRLLAVSHPTAVVANFPSASQHAPSGESGVHCLPGANVQLEQNRQLVPEAHSHCSPACTRPLPHTRATLHLPPAHFPFAPLSLSAQLAPSAKAIPLDHDSESKQ